MPECAEMAVRPHFLTKYFIIGRSIRLHKAYQERLADVSIL